MSPSKPITRGEIIELMRLKGWNQSDLARNIDLTHAAISRWLSGEHAPTGPTRILLRQWLDQAREEAKTRKAEKQPA